jgi:hypothetical protein
MSKIGERIDFRKDGKELYIEISGRIKRWQESVLFGWLVLWTLCGVYIAIFIFTDLSMDEKVFLLVYLSFWAFFEYKAAQAWLWRKWGKERIKIVDGVLEIKNDIRGYGTVKRYFVQNIKEFGKINTDRKSFGAIYFNSFWMVGGETIGFKHLGQKVALGRQLKDDETMSLVRLMKKSLK